MSTLKEKAEAILQEKEEKIIPENFSENLEIMGVQGELPEGDYYGGVWGSYIDTSGDMLTFYGGSGSKQIVGAENTASIGFSNDYVAGEIGLTANKIKKDEVILGITGTYEGSGGNIITYNYFIQDNSGAQPGFGRISIVEYSNGDLVNTIVDDDIDYTSLKNFTNIDYNMLIFGYTLQDYSTNKLVLCNGSNTRYIIQCYGYGGTDLGVFTVLPHSHIYTELNGALNDIIYVR